MSRALGGAPQTLRSATPLSHTGRGTGSFASRYYYRFALDERGFKLWTASLHECSFPLEKPLSPLIGDPIPSAALPVPVVALPPLRRDLLRPQVRIVVINIGP